MSDIKRAAEKYAAYGVDVYKAMETLKNVPISVHCWQGDDVLGFENSGALTGGIQTTGNYPGRARNAEELMADEEAEEPSKFDQWLEKRLGSDKAASVITTIAVILGIGMSIGLFFLLPTLLGTAVTLVTSSMLARNLAESILKLFVFVGYLALCSQLGEMKRVFSYHGAEHKTIFCYEAGLPLTVENVRKQPRHHPRCGTSFLFMVIAISILVSKPDDSMIEVGIKALELVLPEKKGEDAW